MFCQKKISSEVVVGSSGEHKQGFKVVLLF